MVPSRPGVSSVAPPPKTRLWSNEARTTQSLECVAFRTSRVDDTPPIVDKELDMTSGHAPPVLLELMVYSIVPLNGPHALTVQGGRRTAATQTRQHCELVLLAQVPRWNDLTDLLSWMVFQSIGVRGANPCCVLKHAMRFQLKTTQHKHTLVVIKVAYLARSANEERSRETPRLARRGPDHMDCSSVRQVCFGRPSQVHGLLLHLL